MPDSDAGRTDPPQVANLGDSRGRVLDVLVSAGDPLGVGEVATRVGLHPNTVRFHLDGLVEQDLVERGVEERDTPGRPRTLYRARTDQSGAGPRSYQFLAQILAGSMAGQPKQAGGAAVQAGEEWGRFLVDRPEPFRRVDKDTATRRLTEVLDAIGFAPESVTSGRRRQILLRHCPFREVAEHHRDVVCGVHLGLMRGVLAELDAPLDVDRLDPFVEPHLCVTHLTQRRSPPS